MKAGQVTRVLVVIAAGVLLGIGTSSHPPGFARFFAHAWGVATLVVVALVVLLAANRVAEWITAKKQDRRLTERSR